MKIDNSRWIVRHLEVVDHVLTSCPHCGASGKKVHHFLCADGEVRAAMSGCVKEYFREHPVARSIRLWEKRLEKFPAWRKALYELEDLSKQVRAITGGIDKPKRNQFVHLLASMSPEEREPYLDSIGTEDSLDEDWLEADLGDIDAAS